MLFGVSGPFDTAKPCAKVWPLVGRNEEDGTTLKASGSEAVKKRLLSDFDRFPVGGGDVVL